MNMDKSKSVYIWGAGKYGVSTFLSMSKYENINGFIDKDADTIKEMFGLPVVTFDYAKACRQKIRIIIAVASIKSVKEIIETLLFAGLKPGNDFCISPLFPTQLEHFTLLPEVKQSETAIKENVKISVIVPVYNTEQYLRQCLDSIISQTYKNIEIICVNDASTDNSLAILNEYTQKDERVVVIDKSTNQELIRSNGLTRSKGVTCSSGLFIAFVDSDDWIEPNMLEKMYRHLIHGNFDMVCCGNFEDKVSDTNSHFHKILPEDKIGRIKYGIFDFGNSKVVWNKLVKKEIYERVTFSKENSAADCYISCQVYYEADKIGYLPDILYHWRKREESLTHNKNLAMQRYLDRKANYEHIIDFCKEKFGDDLSIFEPELSNRMTWIEDQKPN